MPVASDRLSKLQILKLIQAVHEKSQQKIVKLIENGIPDLINHSEPNDGHTCLHLAACANDEAMINHLISCGADRNVLDFKGRTPYMRAAEFGHLQALTALIEGTTNPDLSAKDLDGKNICYYCLHPTQRHQACLQLVVKYGANVHHCSNDGVFMLYKASEEGLMKAVKTLLDAGIEVNEKHEKTGLSALHISCEKGLEECARLLLKFNGNPNISDKNGNTPVHSAAMNGHLGVLRILSGYGAEFNVLNNKKNSPMHLAATNGFGSLCKYLGQRGCLATIKNVDGKLAKILAKENEHKDALKECKKAEKIKGTKPGTQTDIVKFYDWMIENKDQLEVDAKDYDHEVEGQRSGKIKQEDFVSVMRANKSPLNEEKLMTILKSHDTQQTGQIDFELFFSAKKFINKLYLVGGGKKKKGGGGKKGKKKGKTKIEMPICVREEKIRLKTGGPLMNYVERKQLLTDFTRFDKDHQPQHPIQDDSAWYSYKPDTTFIHINEVIKYNDKLSLKAAIKDGMDVNQVDKFYKTPLMMACLEGNLDVAKYLIVHGANINLLDNFKWTALHFACHIGQKDVVELLLNNGAFIDAQSNNGGTPIMRAIESSKHEVVKFLIDNGAKIQLENKKGQTALDIALAYADPRVIEIVQNRWDQLPPPIDKRKKGSPKKRSAQTTNSANRISMPNIKVSDSSENKKVTYEEVESSSVVRVASAIANGVHLDDSISYTPKRAWLPEPTTTELMAQRQEKRERFGYKVDFEDYKPPFQNHISDLVVKMEIT